MTKTQEEAYKVLSLELSDSLSRKLKEVVTFYPVKKESATYAALLKQQNSPVSISRYDDCLALIHIERPVLSKLAALMFGLSDEAFSKASSISLVEGFFSEYLDQHLNTVIKKDKQDEKERYVVEDLSKQHILYPTDSVDLYEFPVQIDGKELGRLKLCVAQI
mgnify:FL=1